MSDDIDECENYTGTEFAVAGEQIAFVSPENMVAVNTVTYVKGVGMNIRVVTVPGSDWAMFYEEAADYGVCACTPPAVWHFTGIDGTNVCTMTTLSGHEAVHYMRHPDHLFDVQPPTVGAFTENLLLVPAEDGLDMVMEELQDHMVSHGVPDIKADGDLTYSEIKGADVDGLIEKFMATIDEKVDENNDNDTE